MYPKTPPKSIMFFFAPDEFSCKSLFTPIIESFPDLSSQYRKCVDISIHIDEYELSYLWGFWLVYPM